jgi:hypothetical protein
MKAPFAQNLVSWIIFIVTELMTRLVSPLVGAPSASPSSMGLLLNALRVFWPTIVIPSTWGSGMAKHQKILSPMDCSSAARSPGVRQYLHHATRNGYRHLLNPRGIRRHLQVEDRGSICGKVVVARKGEVGGCKGVKWVC